MQENFKLEGPVSFVLVPASEESQYSGCSLTSTWMECLSASSATPSERQEGQQSSLRLCNAALEAYKTVVESFGACTTLPAMGCVTIEDVKS